MEKLNKEIITRLNRIADEVKAGCGCGGSGVCSTGQDEINHCDVTNSSCPCAEVRALDFTLHKMAGSFQLQNERGYNIGVFGPICACGNKYEHDYALKKHCDNKNPDLTTHMHGSKLWIVHVMQVLGVWEEFKTWMIQDVGHSRYALMDICTDGEHLVPAAGAWLEGRG